MVEAMLSQLHVYIVSKCASKTRLKILVNFIISTVFVCNIQTYVDKITKLMFELMYEKF